MLIPHSIKGAHHREFMPLLDPPLMLALISYRTPAASFISQDSFIPANLPWWSALWLLVLVVHFYNLRCLKGTRQVLVGAIISSYDTNIYRCRSKQFHIWCCYCWSKLRRHSIRIIDARTSSHQQDPLETCRFLLEAGTNKNATLISG